MTVNTGRTSQQWDRAARHPELPGGDLCYFELTGGDDICMYDDDNPDAYIIGDGIEVGTRQ